MTDYNFPLNEEEADREWNELTRRMSDEEKNKYINYFISAMNDEDLEEEKLRIDLESKLKKINTKIIIRQAEKRSQESEYGIYKQKKSSN